MIVPITKKKVILVGGSGDIGKAILEKLLQEGFTVGLSYYNNPINLSDPKLLKYKNQLHIEKIDVTNPKEVNKGLKTLINKLGGVDTFIYNAGICEDSLINDMSFENWEKVMDVNINGAFITTKIISDFMLKKRAGKILLVSSYKGIVGAYGQSNYAASKAALIGFAKSISRDLGGFGISVNVLCPGFVVTNLNRDSSLKKKAAIKQSVLSRISNTEEIANFALYLMSDYVVNVSSQVFNVDSRVQ